MSDKVQQNSTQQNSRQDLSSLAVESVMNTYNRFPLTMVKGKGCLLWDEQGNEYLDATSGIGTCSLGHVPDEVYTSVNEQLQLLWHCSNLFTIPSQEQLAALLVEHSCADQVFFCNSGAEANEAAIKVARKYARLKERSASGSDKVEGAYEIVTFKQSFHGRTMATLSATGQEKIQHEYEPLVSGFRHLTFNDEHVLEQIDPRQTVAILVELIQGEGGVVPADREWIQQLVAFCREHDILFMVDEVQTGMGRTGSLFAYEQYDIEPDVITLAKGLGAGFPIAALLAKKNVSQSFTPGTHGSTFGGNPLATTAAKATVETLLKPGFLEQIQHNSAYLEQKLHELKNSFSMITAVQGRGFMQGVRIPQYAAQVVAAARDWQLLILLAGTEVVRLLPPLIMTKAEIDRLVDALYHACEQVTKELAE